MKPRWLLVGLGGLVLAACSPFSRAAEKREARAHVGREVVVSEGAFLVSLNGGKPKRLAGIAEVVRAVSGS